jgi:hypothetical protein
VLGGTDGRGDAARARAQDDQVEFGHFPCPRVQQAPGAVIRDPASATRPRKRPGLEGRGSTTGSRPHTRSATRCPVTALRLTPSMPWPVASHRLSSRHRADDRQVVPGHRPPAVPVLEVLRPFGLAQVLATRRAPARRAGSG